MFATWLAHHAWIVRYPDVLADDRLQRLATPAVAKATVLVEITREAYLKRFHHDITVAQIDTFIEKAKQLKASVIAVDIDTSRFGSTKSNYTEDRSIIWARPLFLNGAGIQIVDEVAGDHLPGYRVETTGVPAMPTDPDAVSRNYQRCFDVESAGRLPALYWKAAETYCSLKENIGHCHALRQDAGLNCAKPTIPIRHARFSFDRYAFEDIISGLVRPSLANRIVVLQGTYSDDFHQTALASQPMAGGELQANAIEFELTPTQLRTPHWLFTIALELFLAVWVATININVRPYIALIVILITIVAVWESRLLWTQVGVTTYLIPFIIGVFIEQLLHGGSHGHCCRGTSCGKKGESLLHEGDSSVLTGPEAS